MIRRVISCCIIAFLISCSPDEPPVEIDAFFNAYKFPVSVGTSTLISNDKIIVIGSSTKPSDNKILLTWLSESGEFLQSKLITIAGNSSLWVNKIVPADENTFLVITYGINGAIAIKADYEGNVISVESYSNPDKAIYLKTCTVTKDGSRICSGVLEGQNGVLFEEDQTGEILWAKSFQGSLDIRAAINETEDAICVVTNSYEILMLNRQGVLVSSKKITGYHSLVLQNMEAIGSYYYALLYTYQGQDYSILKIDKMGDVVKAIRSFNAYTVNPDISVFGTSLFIVTEIESELKVAELDLDLNIVNENTFANLNGGNGAVRGQLSATSDALNGIVISSAIIPPYGIDGINVFHALRTDWKPRCKIADPIELKMLSKSYYVEELSEALIEDFLVENISPEFQQEELLVSFTTICE